MGDPRRIGERVNLTLPVEVVATLDRMGKVSGAGRATIVREWLSEMLPQLEQLALAMELASKKKIDAFDVASGVLRDASAKADQLQLDVKRQRRRAMRKRVR